MDAQRWRDATRATAPASPRCSGHRPGPTLGHLISQKIHMFHTQACPLVDAQIEKTSTYYGNKDVQLINFLGVTDEQEKAH